MTNHQMLWQSIVQVHEQFDSHVAIVDCFHASKSDNPCGEFVVMYASLCVCDPVPSVQLVTQDHSRTGCAASGGGAAGRVAFPVHPATTMTSNPEAMRIIRPYQKDIPHA